MTSSIAPQTGHRNLQLMPPGAVLLSESHMFMPHWQSRRPARVGNGGISIGGIVILSLTRINNAKSSPRFRVFAS